MRTSLVFVGACVLLSTSLHCTPPPVGTLELTARKPKVVDDGETIELVVRAAASDGKIGTGTVSLTSKAGALGTSTIALDEFGTGRTTFSCAILEDPGCAGPISIEASWKGATAELTVRVVERCPGGKLCDGVCARISSDWFNCGACGVQCGKTQACLSGTCQPCPGGDCDSDGWTPAEGDCCDQFDECAKPASVNAGAIEEQGNRVDDNCNGLMDAADPSDGLSCDEMLGPRTYVGFEYARAIGLCRTTTESSRTWGVISAELLLASGEPLPARSDAVSIRPVFGTIRPQEGSRIAVISTGGASDAVQLDPSYTSGGTRPTVRFSDCADGGSPACLDDWFYASNPPLKDSGKLPTAPNCGSASSQEVAHDSVMLRLRIRAPTNVSSFKIKTRFFSDEYPTYVCSPFNDQMVLLIDTPGAFVGNPSDKNLMTYSDPAADGGGSWPVGINLAAGTPLFQSCAQAPECRKPPIDPGSCGQGPAELALTQFAPTSDGGCSNGGTRWMTTRGNVKPGAIFELRAAVWDVGDPGLDSLVLIDDFRWSVDAGVSGTGDE